MVRAFLFVIRDANFMLVQIRGDLAIRPEKANPQELYTFTIHRFRLVTLAPEPL